MTFKPSQADIRKYEAQYGRGSYSRNHKLNPHFVPKSKLNKIQSPYELYMERKKGREEVQKFNLAQRQDAFKRSLYGRGQRAFAFVRETTAPVMQAIQERTAQLKAQNLARQKAEIMQRIKDKEDFDFCFNCGDREAFLLIPEIFNQGDGGASSMGDNAGFSLGREAVFFSSNLSNAPVRDIDAEVFAHSNFQHKRQVKGISQEVDFFSNLLS